jgi:ADP-ribose pyrophosphatase YjhB (NUDIX family)
VGCGSPADGRARPARGRGVVVGRRIDYLDDPDAPAANSLVPSVNVAVVDDDGRLLLIRRSDNDNWALPGGAMDPGESISDAAIRETKEETGIDCEITGLVGIYTNPRHVILYTSDGEVRQECSVVFSARAVGGEPTPSSESSEVLWVVPGEVDGFTMHPSMRQRVAHFRELRDRPYIG